MKDTSTLALKSSLLFLVFLLATTLFLIPGYMIYNLGILMLAPVHIIVCGIWVKSAIDDREKSLADYIVYFFMLALYYWQYKIISDGFTYTWGHKTELSGKIAIPLVISLVLTTLLFLCVPRKNRS